MPADRERRRVKDACRAMFNALQAIHEALVVAIDAHASFAFAAQAAGRTESGKPVISSRQLSNLYRAGDDLKNVDENLVVEVARRLCPADRIARSVKTYTEARRLLSEFIIARIGAVSPGLFLGKGCPVSNGTYSRFHKNPRVQVAKARGGTLRALAWVCAGGDFAEYVQIFVDSGRARRRAKAPGRKRGTSPQK